MTKAKIKKVISGAVAGCNNRRKYCGGEREKADFCCRKACRSENKRSAVCNRGDGRKQKFQDSRNDHSGKRKNCGIGRCEI